MRQKKKARCRCLLGTRNWRSCVPPTEHRHAEEIDQHHKAEEANEADQHALLEAEEHREGAFSGGQSRLRLKVLGNRSKRSVARF